jgi:hypothetical protein
MVELCSRFGNTRKLIFKLEASDLDSPFGYATLSNVLGLLTFVGSTPIADGTYNLGVSVNGAPAANVSTGALSSQTIGAAITALDTNLATGSVGISGGKIVVTSDTSCGASAIVITEGTSNGFIEALNTISGVSAVIDTPVPNHLGYVELNIGTPSIPNDNTGYLVQVRDVNGLEKTGFITTYSTTTGILKIEEAIAGTKFATNDVVYIEVWFYSQI